MNLSRKLFTFWDKKGSREENITIRHFSELKESINTLEFIDFSSSDIAGLKEELRNFYNNVDNIYLILARYLLSWNFLIVSKEDIQELNWLVSWKIEEFITHTVEPEEVEEDSMDTERKHKIQQWIKEMKSMLDILQDDILRIKDIRIFYADKKLSDIEDIWRNKISTFKNNTLVNNKLFAISCSLLEFEFNFQSIVSIKSIKYYLLRLFQNLKEIEGDNEIKDILKEKIQFDLYKILGLTQIDYHYDHTVSQINLVKFVNETKLYKSSKSLIDFIDGWPKTPSIAYKKIIRKKMDNDISMKDIIIKLVHFKDSLKDDKEVKKIYDFYKDNLLDIDNHDDRINYIYIWNHYLSSLICNYETSIDSSLDTYYENEIQLLLKEIKEVASTINSLYSNFFTKLKYSKFLFIKARKQLNKKEYIKSRKTLNSAKNTIISSEEIYFKDTSLSNLYYPFKEELLESTSFENIQYIYHPFLNIPYHKDDYQQIIRSIKNDIDLWLSTIHLKKSIIKVEDDMQSHKTDSMQILWVFAWIVLFASWTIQIFTKIDDLWSALVFVSLYSASLLFLLAGVNFSTYSEFKRSRSVLFSSLAVLVIILSGILYMLFWDNVLNYNALDNSRTKAIEAQVELKQLIIEQKSLSKEIEMQKEKLQQQIEILNEVQFMINTSNVIKNKE